eukprot:CAMPEP_0202047714 /NCGR_PEP_ID=MMETSP0963-20130614/2160_1 /ASSEMBLY_ACC=CAM_ASM_000494 /TAXON_ID=4773 /ORGANISM="Schizochytrium aggregatum, Strain ATCC28209" /LENGTH=124 /DNA_ID=CAMNT_0048612501 /DNA_START=284 /DNA_END=660 /DNA_ORIENTATION=-
MASTIEEHVSLEYRFASSHWAKLGRQACFILAHLAIASNRDFWADGSPVQSADTDGGSASAGGNGGKCSAHISRNAQSRGVSGWRLTQCGNLAIAECGFWLGQPSTNAARHCDRDGSDETIENY